MHAQVVKIRNELRPSDFAGNLTGGEIGVLLRDTPADNAATVSARLKRVLQWDVSAGKVIQPSIGMMSCSPESPFEGSIVRAARENSEVRSQA
jgi:GGDEF domain-containing protein